MGYFANDCKRVTSDSYSIMPSVYINNPYNILITYNFPPLRSFRVRVVVNTNYGTFHYLLYKHGGRTLGSLRIVFDFDT